ncbi:hypothetical protein [Bacillus sp. ISL-75]|nr:hypothetical protein [Bacillus sp. ISL-75]
MTDLELIADIKRGSRSSQEILVRRYALLAGIQLSLPDDWR